MHKIFSRSRTSSSPSECCATCIRTGKSGYSTSTLSKSDSSATDCVSGSRKPDHTHQSSHKPLINSRFYRLTASIPVTSWLAKLSLRAS